MGVRCCSWTTLGPILCCSLILQYNSCHCTLWGRRNWRSPWGKGILAPFLCHCLLPFVGLNHHPVSILPHIFPTLPHPWLNGVLTVRHSSCSCHWWRDPTLSDVCFPSRMICQAATTTYLLPHLQWLLLRHLVCEHCCLVQEQAGC